MRNLNYKTIRVRIAAIMKALLNDLNLRNAWSILSILVPAVPATLQDVVIVSSPSRA